MKTVAEARAAMLAGVRPLAPERAPIAEALGRTVAAPVIARRSQPPYDGSAMDGYAVRSVDAPGPLRVIGESAAGRPFAGAIGPGEAVRIATGGPLPEGADAIVLQEEAPRDGDLVHAPKATPGRHFRRAGGDFNAGDLLLAAGRRLDPAALALAAAAGGAEISVARRPHVALLASGDEIVPPGAEAQAWQIYESGSYGVAGFAEAYGALAVRAQPAADDLGAIAAAAQAALAESDLLVVIGGASVGDHDLARPALERLGLSLLVNKVAVRPGKPTWFGHVGTTPVLGLPGNPASAMACARIFLAPLLVRLQGGDVDASIATQSARLIAPLPPNGDREHYLRARTAVADDATITIEAFAEQDSSMHRVFAAANALLVRPAGDPAQPAGALVRWLAI